MSVLYKLDEPIGVVVDRKSPHYEQAKSEVQKFRREPFPLFLVLIFCVFGAAGICSLIPMSLENAGFVFFGLGLWIAKEDVMKYSRLIDREIARLAAEHEKSL